MSSKPLFWLLMTVLLTTDPVTVTQAQQPVKVPQDRIPQVLTLLRLPRVVSRPSGWVYATLATWREKTFSSSIEMQREN